METRINESTVPPGKAGERLDAYLAQRFTYLSRAAWQREIEGGSVSVNGETRAASHRKLRTGDVIRFESRRMEEPEVDRGYSVLYEDEQVLCVNKPGNIPVHPSGRYFRNTLLMQLQEERGEKLYPVHRLDRETSGVMLFARDPGTASWIQKRFHLVEKSYVAIVHGTVRDKLFTVDMPIGYDPASTVKKRRVAATDAKEAARTVFKKIFTFGDYTLVRAFPETGRLHQIRVHLLYAGYPIAGDKMYGILGEKAYLDFIASGSEGVLVKELGFGRSALHSRSLRFFHPVLGRKVLVRAPLAADMRKFIVERSGKTWRSR